jgi:hypothetical protein
VPVDKAGDAETIRLKIAVLPKAQDQCGWIQSELEDQPRLKTNLRFGLEICGVARSHFTRSKRNGSKACVTEKPNYFIPGRAVWRPVLNQTQCMKSTVDMHTLQLKIRAVRDAVEEIKELAKTLRPYPEMPHGSLPVLRCSPSTFAN